MASNFRQSRIVVGDGNPADGDGICTNLSLFPINTLYINSETGAVFVRNTANGNAADYVQGAGGSSFLPITGTGTATGDVFGELDGNSFNIRHNGNNFILVDPTPDSEQAFFRALNTTDFDNSGEFVGNTTAGDAVAYMTAVFNGGEKLAKIQAESNETESLLKYDADKHRFSSGVNEFADNAAALSGGLEVGCLYYRTGHGLDIVISAP